MLRTSLMRPLRFRVKEFYAVCGAGLVFLYFSFSSWSWHTSSESARLEQFMNDDAESGTWHSNSSFNWSDVPFRYPPGEVKSLPEGKTLPLPTIQFKFGKPSSARSTMINARRQDVRDLFRKNWESYKEYAWMKDALLPISGGSRDQFSGWAATLVDSLDTLWIMGLKSDFDEAVDAVATIDFGYSSSGRVNMFETNIRYLGGLMAAYDLSKRSVLLRKAVELGDLLYAGFNTPNRMPVDFIDFESAKIGDGLEVENTVVSASPGTISLEFTRLSQLTGDPKYYDAITNVMSLFYQDQNHTRLPGLWPTYVSMSTQDVVSGSQFTLAGCADSLYEYLPKMHALLNGRESKYEVMSKAFLETANKTLLFRPMLPDGEDVLLPGAANVADDGTAYLNPETEHLGCFLGGVYAIGGRLFKRDDYVVIGSKLALGCAYAYEAFPTGMMPERLNTIACESRKDCPWSLARWNEEKQKRPEWREHLPLGFTTAKDPRYILRPEAIESIFILYRVTGDARYQDIAWNMFEAIKNGTETEYANAAVKDVTVAQYPLLQEDYMESFWLAETLKYFYLVFSPPDVISLDEYVLNTEAHPFRRPV